MTRKMITRVGDRAYLECLLAADAEPRLQAARLVVEPGVDDLAVVGGGLGADALRPLQYQDLLAGRSERAGDGQAHHAGTDDERFDIVTHSRGRLPEARPGGKAGLTGK